MTRVFLRSPNFDTPTEVYAWLPEQGCPMHDCEVHQGCDGLWRGSGEVHRP